MNNIPVATKEQEERIKQEAMTFDDLMKRFNKGVDQVKEYQGSRLTKEELNSFPRRLVNSGENICLPNDSAELAFIIEDGQAKIKNQIKTKFNLI